MRWVAAILIVLAAGLTSAAQAPRAKQKHTDYYPMKPGTKWTYLVDSGNGKTVAVTNQIAKTETIDGKSLARLEASVNGGVVATEHLTSTAEGVFRCRYNGVEVSPSLCIFKYPFKENATWEADASIGAQQLRVKLVSGKLEDVSTPAGKYKAAPVETETTVAGTKIKAKLWFAPDVGIVKQDTEIGEQKIKMELIKYEVGK
jgi:hypothetical protein